MTSVCITNAFPHRHRIFHFSTIHTNFVAIRDIQHLQEHLPQLFMTVITTRGQMNAKELLILLFNN